MAATPDATSALCAEVFVLEVTPGNILVTLHSLVQALLTPLCLDILEWLLDEAK